MKNENLPAIARSLIVRGKGILAADESLGTIEKRFRAIDLPSTPEHRRRYRELLFSTPGISDFISGVILFDETINQRDQSDVPFPELLGRLGIVPGIKVDLGTKPLPGFEPDKITEGLDGLRERLAKYHELGARFAKWRAVIAISDAGPSDYAIAANAQQLALYAAYCQEAGLVPIVEPEVLMDGGHSIERCGEVTANTLRTVFGTLREARIRFDAMLLKPNMVIPGKDCPEQSTGVEIARSTVKCLREAVPEEVPGVVFLSGGQTERQATGNLNEINKTGPQPWALSFSYGRALQSAALKTWGGREENFGKAQQDFYQRAKLVALAAMGEYSPELESSASA